MSVFQSGSKALITGGASGIGLAVAELCLKSGMHVSIVDFNKETLDLAQKNLKGDLQFHQADVGKEDDWKTVKEKVGEVDFLMLNAGIGGTGTWGDADYFSKVRIASFTFPVLQDRPRGRPSEVAFSTRCGIVRLRLKICTEAQRVTGTSIEKVRKWPQQSVQRRGVPQVRQTRGSQECATPIAIATPCTGSCLSRLLRLRR